MPTAAERLATLEAAVLEIRHDVKGVLDVLNGGDGVTYERSYRGRLHTLENYVAGLALRRSVGLGMVSGWKSALLVLCALVTAACAVIAALSTVGVV